MDAAAIVAANTAHNAQLGQSTGLFGATSTPTSAPPTTNLSVSPKQISPQTPLSPLPPASTTTAARPRTPSTSSNSRSASFSLTDQKSGGKIIRRPSTGASSIVGDDAVEEEESDDEANMDPQSEFTVRSGPLSDSKRRLMTLVA
jgi:hypothetical protein